VTRPDDAYARLTAYREPLGAITGAAQVQELERETDAAACITPDGRGY
jgi:hypothetical protein